MSQSLIKPAEGLGSPLLKVPGLHSLPGPALSSHSLQPYPEREQGLYLPCRSHHGL